MSETSPDRAVLPGFTDGGNGGGHKWLSLRGESLLFYWMFLCGKCQDMKSILIGNVIWKKKWNYFSTLSFYWQLDMSIFSSSNSEKTSILVHFDLYINCINYRISIVLFTGTYKYIQFFVYTGLQNNRILWKWICQVQGS